MVGWHYTFVIPTEHTTHPKASWLDRPAQLVSRCSKPCPPYVACALPRSLDPLDAVPSTGQRHWAEPLIRILSTLHASSSSLDPKSLCTTRLSGSGHPVHSHLDGVPPEGSRLRLQGFDPCLQDYYLCPHISKAGLGEMGWGSVCLCVCVTVSAK